MTTEELTAALQWLMFEEDPARVQRMVEFRSPVLALFGIQRGLRDRAKWQWHRATRSIVLYQKGH